MCRDEVFAYYENFEVDAREDFAVYNAYDEGSPRWDILKAFNISPRDLTFNFSPYDLMPYSYGSSEVTLSWLSIHDILTDPGRRLMKRLTHAG